MTTDAEIAQAAAAAGFVSPGLTIAVAVAFAEGGSVGVCNFDVNGQSCGPWQIHFKDPSTTRVIDGHLYTKDEAASLDGSARAAFGLYLQRGRGFQDWSTYNSGRYLTEIARAAAAIAAGGGGDDMFEKVNDDMERRLWNALAEEADAFGIARPATPEADTADANDPKAHKGWVEAVVKERHKRANDLKAKVDAIAAKVGA